MVSLRSGVHFCSGWSCHLKNSARCVLWSGLIWLAVVNTAKADSLGQMQIEGVDNGVTVALSFVFGQKCSVWSAATNAMINVPGAIPATIQECIDKALNNGFSFPDQTDFLDTIKEPPENTFVEALILLTWADFVSFGLYCFVLTCFVLMLPH